MKSFSLLLFSIVCMSVSAQSWEWARKADATASYESALNTKTDGFGNIYLRGNSGGGSQYGSTVLGAGEFLVKFDPNGSVIWAKNINFFCPSSYHVSCFNVDVAGNSYYTGQFRNTLSVLSYNLVSHGEEDVFILKLDPSGNPVLGKNYGGPSGEAPGSIYADEYENIYFDGGFGNTISFDSHTLYDSTGTFFLAKLNPAGNALWATTGHSSFAYGQLIVPDKHSNIYVVGYATSYYGYFISKFDANGNLLFRKTEWGMYDYVPALVVSDLGNIFLLHNGAGHYAFVPILCKYDSLMNMQWSKGIGTYYGCYQFSAGVVVDESENVFVGGGLGGYYCHDDSVYFDGALAYIGDRSVPTLAMFNTSGNLVWIKSAKSSDYDGVGAMCMDKDGSLIAAGGLNGSVANDTLVFDGITLINDGSWRQIFLSKLNPSSVATDLAELNPLDFINVFPNPSSGLFTLRMNKSHAEASVIVSDVMGRCILKKECKNETHEIDLSAQGKGVYFLEVIAEGKKVVKKIVVQ